MSEEAGANWRLDPIERGAFFALVAGALLFSAMVLIAPVLVRDLAMWPLTPLFGIGWTVWAFRRLAPRTAMVRGAVVLIGCFLICAGARMLKPGVLPVVAAGTTALVILGSIGLRFTVFFDWGSASLAPMLILYLPWQLVFALVLAKVLKS